MKKWITVIVILVLLVLLVAPGGMGMLAQKRINKLVMQLPADSPIGVNIVSYKRGWFSSVTQLDITLNKIQHTPPIHFLVNETIKHGPVIIDLSNKYVALGQAYAAGELFVPDDEQAFFKQYVDQTSLLTGSVLLHLFGGVTLNVATAELTLSDPADKSMKITLEGASTTLEMNAQMDRIKSNFELQALSAQSAQSTFTLNNLEGTSDLAKSPEALWLGKVNVQANSATLNTNSKAVFDVKGIQYSSESDESKGLVGGSCSVSLQNVVADGVDYGSGQIGLSLKNINAEPFQELRALTQEISQAQQAQTNGLAATFKLQQKALQSRQLVFRMLGRGVQFAIDPVSLQTPNGEILGKFTLSLPNLLDDAKGNPLARPIITIGALISNANSSLSLSVPKVILQNKLQKSILTDMQAMNQGQAVPVTPEELTAAATQQATAQIQNWVNSGFLLENGANYQFSATFDKGQLLANGKPVFSPVSQALAGAVSNNPVVVTTPAVNDTVIVNPAPAASDTTVVVPAPTPNAAPVVAPAPVANGQPIAAPAASTPVAPVPVPAVPVTNSPAASAPVAASSATTGVSGN